MAMTGGAGAARSSTPQPKRTATSHGVARVQLRAMSCVGRGRSDPPDVDVPRGQRRIRRSDARPDRHANPLSDCYLPAFPLRVTGPCPATPFACSLAGMVDAVDFNVFETANAGFAQAMYEEFLRDPAAVGPEWRRLFESGVVGERPDGNGAAAPRPLTEPRPAVAAAMPPTSSSAAAPSPGTAPAPATDLPAGASAIKGPA